MPSDLIFSFISSVWYVYLAVSIASTWAVSAESRYLNISLDFDHVKVFRGYCQVCVDVVVVHLEVVVINIGQFLEEEG
jgi:hypothetical protein